MPATLTQSVTTAQGTGTVVISNLQTAGNMDNVAAVQVSGTFTTATWTYQGSFDGTNWQNIESLRLDTGAFEQTPTTTNSTVRQWIMPVDGLSQFRVNVTAVGTGTVTFTVNTFYKQPGGQSIVSGSSLSGNQAISGTFTVTSNSANAEAVGPNGVTTPSFNVDASTASAVTGLNVKSAASGAGVALSVISSSANESMTINAKGTGQTTFQSATAPPLNGAANASILFSANASFGIYFGTGVPTISAAQGSLFLATNGSSTSTRLFVNNNSGTGWVSVTTSA